MTDRSLYDITGDIKDINTVLINLKELRLLRQKAELFEWLEENVKETILNPRAFNSELCPDTRLKWELPVLVSTTAINSSVSFSDSVEIARSKHETKANSKV
jgi:glutaredoxin-related protein